MVRAITVEPGVAGSARLEQVAAPESAPNALLVEAVALGICGTDREIVAGKYGWAPPGRKRLILGHESLARVVEAPDRSGFDAGDLVVPIVRMPDPVPCANCAAGEWDMCSNGKYTEHGIKSLDGFGTERFRVPTDRVVRLEPSLDRLGVLLEPTSVVAKAWEHTERIGQRATWRPRIALVTGAGPIGLLAALLGVQRGLEVHVLDRATAGPKPGVVRALGATYHSENIADLELDADVVMECTGAAPVVADVLTRTRRNGIVCLTGVSSGGRRVPLDIGAVNREMVLENDVVFGSVNANRRHYEAAAKALAQADSHWLSSLITRRVSLDHWADALQPHPDDIKVVVEFGTADSSRRSG
ncbi:MAG TPA: glucose 1-dehydrogenase [Gemmatimonadaceae bacterium]|nr:glucose 1-dehydrogenase [Gemmatimonadaceae bacterium]